MGVPSKSVKLVNYFKSALDGAKRRLRCSAPIPGSGVGAPKGTDIALLTKILRE